ncbi:MAG: phytoene desaturase family protein [Balneolaceae bacterium]
MNKSTNISIIGGGLAGLIGASHLARKGYNVTLFEKHHHAGGRLRSFEAKGYTFDMGPSWYWMPEVFESCFHEFGYDVSDFYQLKRLDPSYTVFWKESKPLRVPADPANLGEWFESRESGSSKKLELFLKEAEFKYNTGMKMLANNPMQNLGDYLDPSLFRHLFRLDLFTSMNRHIGHYFKDTQIRMLLGFPVLFLGGTSRQIPALYSMMNHADLNLGTWYPMGGMSEPANAFYRIALEQGVHFHFGEEVTRIVTRDDQAISVVTEADTYKTDGIIGAGDYHHIEQNLLPLESRNYSESWWSRRTMAPSSLLFFVGIEESIPELTHHNLFFDEDLDRHAEQIYNRPEWPDHPLFYLCNPSKTDSSTAPEGCENLFFLIPVAPGLEESDEIKNRLFENVLQKLERHTGRDLKAKISFRRSFGIKDFTMEYNSYRGNAYGLANTLLQTGVFKPSMRNPKVKNMVYAGQLTHPGPGMPPSIMSGKLAAGLLDQTMRTF